MRRFGTCLMDVESQIRLSDPAAGSPWADVIGLEELKAQLRLDGNAEDIYLRTLITAARERAEDYCGRAFMTQSWRANYKDFADMLRLPRPPLQSVTAVQYVDSAGIVQTVDAGLYEVDSDALPPVVAIKPDADWPEADTDRLRPVRVQFVAGYGSAADVPTALRHAVTLLAAHWYEQRVPVVVGSGLNAHEIPFGAQFLLDTYRVWKF